MTKGQERNTGNIVTDIYPDKFPTLLRWALGTVVTTGAAAPYTHKISVADALTKTFTTRIGVDQAERVIPCCQIDRLDLDMAVKDVLLKATLGMVGSGETKAAIGTPTPLPSEEPFTFGDTVTASIATLTGKEAIIEALSVRVDNDIPERYTHAGLKEKRVGTGEATVTGDLDLLFPDTLEYDRFLAGASFALQWKIARGAYPSLQIDLPKIYYNKGAPHIAKRNELKLSCAFRAAYGTIATIYTPILITVLNAEATI